MTPPSQQKSSLWKLEMVLIKYKGVLGGGNVWWCQLEERKSMSLYVLLGRGRVIFMNNREECSSVSHLLSQRAHYMKTHNNTLIWKKSANYSLEGTEMKREGSITVTKHNKLEVKRWYLGSKLVLNNLVSFVAECLFKSRVDTLVHPI